MSNLMQQDSGTHPDCAIPGSSCNGRAAVVELQKHHIVCVARGTAEHTGLCEAF